MKQHIYKHQRVQRVAIKAILCAVFLLQNYSKYGGKGGQRKMAFNGDRVTCYQLNYPGLNNTSISFHKSVV